MKNTLAACLLPLIVFLLTLSSCKHEPNINVLRKEVLSLHDQVMEEDERAMLNKMALDSITKAVPAKADSAEALSKQFDIQSDHMMDWMHGFDPDQKRKPDNQFNTYLTQQKAQLLKLDSTYKSLLSLSDNFLKQQHVKIKHSISGMKM